MSIKKEIQVGQKFGRLTVLEREEAQKKWVCACECGRVVSVQAAKLNNGNTKSCGCLRDEIRSKIHTKHGMADTKLHRVWIGMKQRCFNQSNKSYAYYGGRGITVCEEWCNSFQAFYEWAVANGYKEGLQIDRVDGNGDYCPENCAWVTSKTNNKHRRLTRDKHGKYASA